MTLFTKSGKRIVAMLSLSLCVLPAFSQERILKVLTNRKENSQMWENMKLIGDYLESKLPVEFEYTSTNSVAELTDKVKSGEYHLHVIPNASESNDVFATYYTQSKFWQNASLLDISSNTQVSMTMLAKGSASGNSGNGKIKGRVVDTDEGGRLLETALEGIVVYLIEDATGEVINSAITDEEGFFEMLNFATGAYRLQVEVIGVEVTETLID